MAFKVNESEERNRTPLVLLAQDRAEKKSEVLEKMRVEMKMEKLVEIDLRKLDHLSNETDRKGLESYRQEIKEDLAEAMADGHLLVVNLDDNEELT